MKLLLWREDSLAAAPSSAIPEGRGARSLLLGALSEEPTCAAAPQLSCAAGRDIHHLWSGSPGVLWAAAELLVQAWTAPAVPVPPQHWWKAQDFPSACPQHLRISQSSPRWPFLMKPLVFNTIFWPCPCWSQAESPVLSHRSCFRTHTHTPVRAETINYWDLWAVFQLRDLSSAINNSRADPSSSPVSAVCTAISRAVPRDWKSPFNSHFKNHPYRSSHTFLKAWNHVSLQKSSSTCCKQ